jgi:ATP-binding protein involved in chromosome partitioning
MASESGVALLGELPLDARIQREADGGRPSVVADPDSARAQAYVEAGRRAAAALANRTRDRSVLFPKIVVEDT